MNAIVRALSVALAVAAAGCTTHPAAVLVPAAQSDPAAAADLVVLVHGMGRTPLSMLRMERALERAGFEVLNWGYSSSCCRVDQLADRLRDDLGRHTGGRPTRVHFVAHSLGTVIVRAALSEGIGPVDAGRIVLLAPPSRGARSADRAAPWLGWLLPPLADLATSSSAAASVIWPAGAEIAVLAGRFDGKVSIAEASLEGAALVVLPATHTFLMMRGDAIRLTLEFLRTGRL